jgi:hypothetical protein
MVASLLKVISSGIQDERLDFKHTLYPYTKVWIKAGRFTTQWGRLEFENTPTFGNTAFFRILRKGHLVTRLLLVATMPDIWSSQNAAATAAAVPPSAIYPKFGWTNSLGHALVEQLTLDIAAGRVETIDSRLLEMLDEFHTPLEKVPIVNELIKRKDNGFTETSFGWPPVGPQTTLPQSYKETVVVPLPFWFTRGDFGCPLPIDAIPMDEIRVGVSFRNLNGCYYTDTHVTNTSLDPGTSLWPLAGSNFYLTPPTSIQNPGTPITSNGTPIQMPLNLQLGDCYILAEYVYLDQNEANRFRLADLQIPVVQHYAMKPFQTQKRSTARIGLNIPNPTKDIFFMLNREEAPSYNAYFLATRDLTGNVNTLPNGSKTPWWPDAIGLYTQSPSIYLRPGFALSDSEPIQGYEIDYQGSIVRFRTQGSALFRSIIPSYEQRKTPWINRYYYNFPMGIQNGFTPFSKPQGEANLDKIVNRDLVLNLRPARGYVGGTIVPSYTVYTYAETYNILRVYGGRAGLMFAY